MEARHVYLYEEAARHEQEQANKLFSKVQQLESQLLIAKSQYKHHKEESERLQIMVKRWKEQENEIKSKG
ncbi:hypothetical protein CON65_02530 [Bacillus pseudomycoides]|uniref:Uncharacterized protein n=1 Tax=Bacillus pseudomycoides TaxID=64104 RepID=A0AA91VFL8_9BACI|nr:MULTISPECIES: hypothetical protein [Bacillus]PED84328.1 hypothetical protein CON65_02530 [Bacillus pseudomycoides]PEU08683.1 hypothetical protein CN525_25720 [Bacillus sp. AFS014408]PEU15855.1 hypothetical protein CN524_06235 [Bacillus sp. AFS019443]PFW64845.1 hypothetical protein COL20_02325 [Bacillus sp. AFS075034]